ncbi:MAG: YaeQ family protein [Betaproteobacteria bacterium]|nr:YaeQ family protein [Betaproteobacteria bacterium]
MALKATIFKAELQIADMDRGHYADYALTLARHPSETDERMLVRLAAFMLHADETLAFASGLSSEDEPDLWRRDLTGRVRQWITVGLPDEKAVRKACGRADAVCIVAYGGHAAQLWWKKNASALAGCKSLTVVDLPQASTRALAALARRNMQLQCSIQEGLLLVTNGDASVQLEPRLLKAAS